MTLVTILVEYPYRTFLRTNVGTTLDHRYNCDSCEGDCEGDNCVCEGDNCVWFYDTAEDWFYDDYIYNCHTGPDGVIEFKDLSDFWAVQRNSYQDCTICWNNRDDCNYFINYDLMENKRYLQEHETRRKLNDTCPQNLVWCYNK